MPEGVAVNFDGRSVPASEPWSRGWPQSREEFGAFVDVFLDRMVCFAYRRLGDRESAEDVVQDVFVKAYADRAKLRRVDRVAPYLYRMVMNACIEQIRRGRKDLSLDDLSAEGLPDTGVDTSEQVSEAEGVRRVAELLGRLPEDQADVVSLRVLDGLSFAEIASVIGCSVSTVKSRFTYGLRKLRRMVPCAKEGSL